MVRVGYPGSMRLAHGPARVARRWAHRTSLEHGPASVVLGSVVLVRVRVRVREGEGEGAGARVRVRVIETRH